MRPIEFENQDVVLGAPAGWDEGVQGKCVGLPVAYQEDSCVSLWKLTDSEIGALSRGGHVILRVVSGRSQPPVSLEVQDCNGVSVPDNGWTS